LSWCQCALIFPIDGHLVSEFFGRWKRKSAGVQWKQTAGGYGVWSVAMVTTVTWRASGPQSGRLFFHFQQQFEHLILIEIKFSNKFFSILFIWKKSMGCWERSSGSLTWSGNRPSALSKKRRPSEVAVVKWPSNRMDRMDGLAELTLNQRIFFKIQGNVNFNLIKKLGWFN